MPDRCAECGVAHPEHEGHHCYDWDFMWIADDAPEMDAYVCGYKDE